jgi:hypothetical protein
MLLLALLSPTKAAPPPVPTGPLPEWPCHGPEDITLSIEQVYGGPPPGQPMAAGAWQTDARVKEAVLFAAAPENPPNRGVARITALARSSDDRERDLSLLLGGIIERVNALRAILKDGVGDKVAKSRLLSERLAEIEEQQKALPAEASPKQRQALSEAADWTRHALGDNAEEADVLCRRIEYTETKARALAHAVAEQIHGS